MKFLVLDGNYPFKDVIGTVDVDDNPDVEALHAAALSAAIKQFGGHPVVSQLNEELH
jgi:hypothetical protein